MKSLKLSVWLIFMVITLLLVAGCSSDDNDKGANNSDVETIKLDIVTAFAENAPDMIGYQIFKEKIEEIGEGEIELNYIGGPETIDSTSQGSAISSGTADISILPSAYIDSFPEGEVLSFSELTPQEERDSGALEKLNEVAIEKLNAIILGRAYADRFSMYLKEPISSIDEFKGLKLRGSPSYKPFIESLGAEFINISKSELYSAVERGVVDGFGGTDSGMVDQSMDEVFNAKVYPTYNNPNIIILMNNDAYEDMSDKHKEVLEKVISETELEVQKKSEEAVEKENKDLESNGIEIITLEGADEERYSSLAHESAKNWLESNLSGQEDLYEMFLKDE